MTAEPSGSSPMDLSTTSMMDSEPCLFTAICRTLALSRFTTMFDVLEKKSHRYCVLYAVAEDDAEKASALPLEAIATVSLMRFSTAKS